MTTDILIPLGQGSRYDNMELRMCLRSIEKHLSGVGNIFIIGECPEWVINVQHITATDNPAGAARAHNIFNKIIIGCKVVTDNFLFMNDDHFLLSDFVAGEFPYLHRGPIVTHRIGNEGQEKQMSNTVNLLKKWGYGIKDFDVHCPIVYNKYLFTENFYLIEWPEYGYGIKSIYGNWQMSTFSVATFCEDLKFSEPLMKESIYRVLEGRDWFSIGDKCLRSGGMQEVLQELYPVKSKYEL